MGAPLLTEATAPPAGSEPEAQPRKSTPPQWAENAESRQQFFVEWEVPEAS